MTPLAWQYISLWLSMADLALVLSGSEEQAKRLCFERIRMRCLHAYNLLSSSEQQAICNLIQGKTLDEVRQAHERKTP